MKEFICIIFHNVCFGWKVKSDTNIELDFWRVVAVVLLFCWLFFSRLLNQPCRTNGLQSYTCPSHQQVQFQNLSLLSLLENKKQVRFFFCHILNLRYIKSWLEIIWECPSKKWSTSFSIYIFYYSNLYFVQNYFLLDVTFSGYS